MASKYLILKGCAGLGNRLITLSNAIEYAQSTNRILYVDWSDGQFGVKEQNVFYKYFQLKNIRHIKNLNEIKNLNRLSHYPVKWGEDPTASVYDLYFHDEAKYLKHLIKDKHRGGLSKIHRYWREKTNGNKRTNSDWEAIKSIFRSNDIPFGGGYSKTLNQDVVFYADFMPDYSKDILRNTIALEQSIQQKTISFVEVNSLAKNTIGVHVRMTDKKPEFTLNELVIKINKIGLDNPQIFIATDSDVAEQYLKKHFKNLIFTLKNRPDNKNHSIGVHQHAILSGDYKDVELTFQDSIIDMWLLSQCEYLIYQKNSSFSEVSSVIKNESNKTFSW